MILSPEAIDYTGSVRPSVVVALGPEGVARRRKTFAALDASGVVVQAAGVEVPASAARTHRVDLKAQGFKGTDWALASLAVMAKLGLVVGLETLETALAARLRGETLSAALEIVRAAQPGEWVG
jgi:hypothetical protein